MPPKWCPSVSIKISQTLQYAYNCVSIFEPFFSYYPLHTTKKPTQVPRNQHRAPSQTRAGDRFKSSRPGDAKLVACSVTSWKLYTKWRHFYALVRWKSFTFQDSYGYTPNRLWCIMWSPPSASSAFLKSSLRKMCWKISHIAWKDYQFPALLPKNISSS